MTDKISIVVPIYNAERYLEECVNSLKMQSYSNIEIILINDGSVDNSAKICDELKKNDARIKVIHNANNGVSISRNLGIDISEGKYVTFVDADDYVSNKYVENLYNLIVENNADISVTGNDEIFNGTVIRVNKKINKILTLEETIKELLKEKYISSVCWGKLYKKEIIEKNKIIFDSKLKIGEDFKFIIEVLQNSGKIVIDTRENLYHYRVNENSVTQQQGRESDWHKEIELANEVMNWIKEKYPSLEIYGIQRFIRTNITFYTKRLKGQEGNIKKDLSQFKNNVKKYSVTYLIKSEAEIKYKVKFLGLLFCPNLLRKIYKIKNK